MRSGDRAPSRAVCATTAKTRPDSSARRLPVAESTSIRLPQARVSVMPQPNIRPPRMAPDRLPVLLSCRTAPVSNNSNRISACVAISAVAKTNSQTAMRSPTCPCATSSVAARRQKREHCAKAPNSMPIDRAAERQQVLVADEVDQAVEHQGLM